MKTMKTIEIDAAVYETLLRNIRSFEDNPNTVLRRILRLDTDRVERHDTTIGQSGISNEFDSPLEPSLVNGQKADNPRRSRARSGEILGMDEYHLPIMRALDRLGGQASSRQVLEVVETLMGDALTGKDLEKQESGEIRWRYRAQMSRLAMVKGGLLDSEAPHGTWILTEKGRKRARQNDAIKEESEL